MNWQEILHRFIGWFDLDFWEVMLVCLMIAGLALVWRATRSKSNPYDFTEVMQDDLTGKSSFKKMAGLVALIATTWGFLRLVSYHELPEWYAQLYFLTWALVLMIPGLAAVAGEIVKTWALRGVPVPPPTSPPPPPKAAEAPAAAPAPAPAAAVQPKTTGEPNVAVAPAVGK